MCFSVFVSWSYVEFYERPILYSNDDDTEAYVLMVLITMSLLWSILVAMLCWEGRSSKLRRKGKEVTISKTNDKNEQWKMKKMETDLRHVGLLGVINSLHLR